MIRRPPGSTLTDPLFPYTTLFRSFDLAGLDSAGPDFIHLVIEAMKLAYADREIYYGDPKFCSVPLEHLLSSGYNDARRALISESASYDSSEERREGTECVSTSSTRWSPAH